MNKLKDTVFSFKYNDLRTFEYLIKHKNIGCVIMEVSRNYIPSKEFLSKIRDLTKKRKIVLIFDECSSGFREVFGGLHLIYSKHPLSLNLTTNVNLNCYDFLSLPQDTSHASHDNRKRQYFVF